MSFGSKGKGNLKYWLIKRSVGMNLYMQMQNASAAFAFPFNKVEDETKNTVSQSQKYY